MSLKEPTLLQLHFLGEPMATLAWRADLPAFALECDQSFLERGHDLSPLHLPLELLARGPQVFRPGDTPFTGGLPGLIADSLPDAWGERMLHIELPGLQTVIGKLAAIGQRGPGAITFEPVLGNGGDTRQTTTSLAALADKADELRTSVVPLDTGKVNTVLARGGSTLGGAFPKISAHLPLAGDTLDLQKILVGGQPPAGHCPCILKFARSSDEAEGAVEFAWSQMARAAGIRVPRAALVADRERRHFACARFDRHARPDDTWGRRHVHTLSGMLHKRASDGAIDYEEFIRLTRNLCGVTEAAECFRRAVFNLLAVNRDDHGRNHAFLYDEATRTWTLAPAYDLNPNVANVLIGLTWLGRQEIPRRFDDLVRLAALGGLDTRQAKEIYQQVEDATLGGWETAARHAGVPAAVFAYWKKEMETQTKALREDVRRTGQPALSKPSRRKR
ncbi:type II toxin-antitoxin system HipA family toxin [Opitutaceae bacterium TAV4]|nr:type II toxin-antitoxin system HipA family toxin [Opitutaceae bacterium TAV4]RRK02075.1 type II toxin-antitoxin system HipA family toxin [Opitutaceae bacterium TAV3]